MLPDRVSNPEPLTYESGALPIALHDPAGSEYLLPDIKGCSKTNITSSKYWWLWNSPVTTLCQIYDQTQFHMVKGIDNGIVFCLFSRIIIAVKIGMFFQDITSTTEFLGNNFLLPTI